MIGITLARYFFLRHLAVMAWFLFGVSALVFMIDFTEFSSRTASLASYRVGIALGLSLLRLPFILQQVMPFLALFGAMTTLFALNRRYELVIARSAGVSAWQFLLPIGLAALIYGLVSLFVFNPIGAIGIERANEVEARWKSGVSNATTASPMPWFSQRGDGGEIVVGAHAVLEGGTVLVDATFFLIDDEKGIVERIDAARAVLADGAWNLEKVIRRPAGGDPVSEPVMRIASNLTPEAVSERIAVPDMIPFPQLYRKIAVLEAHGYRADAFRMQLHALLAQPLLLVAMTLIAATVSLRFARFGQSWLMILGGIGAGFLLYVVSVLAKAFGGAGIVPPAAAAWFPVAAAMFVGVTYLLYREDG